MSEKISSGKISDEGINDTANVGCRILLDVLTGQGLRDAVLSPGSRNAPLLIAAAARPELHSHIVTDERTAGFVALGMAVASRKPVLLVCTSGTAMYNYAPAVAEAMYQHIPLIVVTADRPARWIDQDDSQTLRQPDALSNIVRRSFNISTAEGENISTRGKLFASEREWFINRTVNEAWIAATHGTPGPVHINIQLDNPLGETETVSGVTPQRIIHVVEGNRGLDPESLKQWAEHLYDKKILLVAGFMQPDHRLSQAVNEMMRLPNLALCSEPLSNLRVDAEHRQIDALLHPRNDNPGLAQHIRNELRPDVVIAMGGALVSRMLKDFLREYQPAELYTLSDTDCGSDCFQSLTTHFDVPPLQFIRGITSMTGWLQRHRQSLPAQPAYGEMWHEARKKYVVPVGQYAAGKGWSEMLAFHRIFEAMPRDYNLFLSNGTPVRYGGICLDDMPHAVYGNRGVSGIEGTSATAAGIAMRYSGTTLLITGDMSFGYAPQILGLDLLPDTFKIIVINNAGGGIFRFIGTTRSLTQREEYFCADRPQPLQALAQAFGWQYIMAESENDIDGILLDFYASAGKTLLEIRVDPDRSAKALIEYLN